MVCENKDGGKERKSEVYRDIEQQILELMDKIQNRRGGFYAIEWIAIFSSLIHRLVLHDLDTMDAAKKQSPTKKTPPSG